MRAPQSITRRANSYAGAKIRLGTHATGEYGPLAEGWRDGYRRAMSEVRRVLWKSSKPLFDLNEITKPERMK